MTQSNYEYIGWVPCVSGQLFYDFACCGLGRRKKITINNIEQSKNGEKIGYLYISSIVDWKDKGLARLDGNFFVIMTGKYKLDIPGACLTGNIYILSNRKASHQWQEIYSKSKLIKKQSLNHCEIAQNYYALIEKITKTEDEEFHTIKYTLQPNGIALLKLVNNASNISSIHRKTITRQSFYYLKYAVHKHQHHSTSDDALTTIHLITDDKNQNALNLINNLKKSLVCLKRDFSSTRYKWLSHTRGISIYARSLIEACYFHEYIKEDVYEREKSYFNNLSDSLEITTSNNIAITQNHLAIGNHIRSIILFCIAIFGPLLLIYRENIRESAELNKSESGSIDTHSSIDLLGRIFSNPDDFLLLFVIPMICIFGAYWVFLLIFGNLGIGLNWILNKARQSQKRVSNIILILALLLVFISLFYFSSVFL